MHSLNLGLEGEKTVAEQLSRDLGGDYQISHDLLLVEGESSQPLKVLSNIDHLLIGPAGIFVVETKAYSKPPRGDGRATVSITAEGQLCFSDGIKRGDPVLQAKRQAWDMCKLLEDRTQRKFAVQPILVLVGWWVEDGMGAPQGVWVLNHKMIAPRLRRELERLSESDIEGVRLAIDTYIRDIESRRT